MFRFMRKREGFTLIELMMVVAVIGILAAVLIPRIGNTKNEARLAGMDTNVRQVQSFAEANIGRYQANDANNDNNFAARISNASTGIQNPFTPNNTGGATSATIPATSSTAVVAITDSTVAAPTAADADLAGTLIVTFTATNNAITSVVITPYDNLGNALPPTTVNR